MRLDEGLAQAIEDARRRKYLAGHILEITEHALFSTRPEDVESDTLAYADLYAKRDTLVAELGTLPYSPDFSASAEYQRISLEANELIRQIIHLDKKYTEQAQTMMAHVKGNIRRLKQGIAVTQRYDDMPGREGTRLDSKN
jgi:hypothetical protein